MFSNLSTLGIVFFLVSLLIGMIIHEVMHGVAAYLLGDNTAADMGRLTVNPLKHVDALTTIALPLVLVIFGQPPIFAAKPVPFNPNRVKWGDYGSAIVGIAGPLTNFILALIGALLIHVLSANPYLFSFLIIFTEVNVALMVFNLIPFPPLDGSRVIYALAPEPVREVMEKIESMGFIVILLFIFFVFQFIAPVIGNIESSILSFLIGL